MKDTIDAQKRRDKKKLGSEKPLPFYRMKKTYIVLPLVTINKTFFENL